MRITVTMMAILLTVSSAGAQTYSAEQVMAKMDANARTFKSLEASVEQKRWNKLLNAVQEADSGTGKLFIQTTGKSPRIKLELTEPKKFAQSMLVDNGKAQIYYRSQNVLNEYDVKSDDHLQLLLIGFGVSSEIIKKTFNVGPTKPDSVNGKQVTILELKAKDEKAPKVPQIRLWISHEDWTPVKTEITMPTRDTHTVTYKDKKLNKGVNNSVFKLDVPKDAKKQ